jgi:molybdenum cofactor cytidylyltransferase
MIALIPAAGHSTRMGRPKLALPLGDRTILEGIIQTLKAAEVAEIVVVIGPHVSELVPLSARAGAHAVLLAEATPDMRTTVERGLDWIERTFQPKPEDAWLLIPADYPALDVDAVRYLMAEFQKQSHCSIAVPTFAGRRGHPALIAWKHVREIRTLPADAGLNAYLRQHSGETLEVPVPSDGVLIDLDTAEDYARLTRPA